MDKPESGACVALTRSPELAAWPTAVAVARAASTVLRTAVTSAGDKVAYPAAAADVATAATCSGDITSMVDDNSANSEGGILPTVAAACYT